MKKGLLIALAAVILTVGIGAGGVAALIAHHKNAERKADKAVSEQEATEEMPNVSAPASLARPHFLEIEESKLDYTPSIAPYHTDSQLSNVINKDYVYLQDKQKEKLAANNFVVMGGRMSEFFET